VAVGVRLDGRLDPNSLPDRLADCAEIGDQRIRVDLEPGGPRKGRQAGGREPGFDRLTP
jgi:hypothetical protein